MNIFQVLRKGHGNISETNVSAFLGYLLDPSEDHGLKDELFRKIMIELKSKSNDGDFFNKIPEDDLHFNNSSQYGVDVHLEHALNYDLIKKKITLDKSEKVNGDKKKDKKKEIVDIIMLIYKKIKEVDLEMGEDGDLEMEEEVDLEMEDIAKDAQKKKSTRANKESRLLEKRIPVAVILLENKIDARPTNGQLENQYCLTHAFLNTHENLKGIIDKNNAIYTVYVTPKGSSYDTEFRGIKKELNYELATNGKKIKFKHKGIHLVWNNDENEKKNEPLNLDEANNVQHEAISDMISKIITEESVGNIEPLQDYTKHTLKAFVNFIKSRFTKKDDSIRGIDNVLENSPLYSDLAKSLLRKIDAFLKKPNDFREYADIERTTNETSRRVSFHLKNDKIFLQINVMENTLIFLLRKRNPLEIDPEYLAFTCDDTIGAYRVKKKGIKKFGDDEQKMIRLSYHNVIE